MHRRYRYSFAGKPLNRLFCLHRVFSYIREQGSLYAFRAHDLANGRLTLERVPPMLGAHLFTEKKI